MNVYLDDLASVERELAKPWGTVSYGGIITQRICPLCVALIPADYTNAHEVTETPQKRHADTHRAVAHLLRRATTPAPRLGGEREGEVRGDG